MGTLRRLVRERRGIAAIEFAMVAPLFFLMIFGINELSDYVRAFTKTGAAAAAVANLIAAQSTVHPLATGAGSVGDYCLAAEAVLSPYSKGAMHINVASRSLGDTSNDWDVTCYNAGSAAYAADTSLTNTIPPGLLNAAGDNVIEVQVTYNYKATTTFYLTGTIPIVDTAYARPRGNGVIPLAN